MVDPKNIPMERSRDCVEIDFLHINIQKKISLFRLFASSQEPKRQLARNLPLYPTKYCCALYRTLQNVAFSSFVKTLNFAIRQQTDTKQTCLKCLLSRRFQTEFVFCLDGALRKSTKRLQNCLTFRVCKPTIFY